MSNRDSVATKILCSPHENSQSDLDKFSSAIFRAESARKKTEQARLDFEARIQLTVFQFDLEQPAKCNRLETAGDTIGFVIFVMQLQALNLQRNS